MTKKTNNYVDNEKLSDAILDWVGLYNTSVEKNLPKPRIPEYIGESILLIAVNLARLPKFNRYTWLEEMVGDAVENTLKYLHNFNGGASTRIGKPNAFSWITISMERVFYDRIESENRQLYYRNKMGVETLDGLGDEVANGDLGSSDVAVKMANDMRDRVGSYEEHQRKRKEKERAKNEEKKLLTPTEHRTISLNEIFLSE